MEARSHNHHTHTHTHTKDDEVNEIHDHEAQMSGGGAKVRKRRTNNDKKESQRSWNLFSSSWYLPFFLQETFLVYFRLVSSRAILTGKSGLGQGLGLVCALFGSRFDFLSGFQFATWVFHVFKTVVI